MRIVGITYITRHRPRQEFAFAVALYGPASNGCGVDDGHNGKGVLRKGTAADKKH